MSSEQQYIEARQQRLTEAWNSMKVEKLMGMMADEGLEYDDYAIDQIAMSKPHMTAVFSHLFDVVDDLVFVGHSLQGTKSHTSWEYTMSTRQVKDSPVMGPAKPETVLKMRGCAVAWWNETDEIVKCHDYSIWIVEKGEGEGKE